MIKIVTKDTIKECPNAVVIDLTQPWNKLSPYYPYGDIPISNTPYQYSSSVNEIWQKLYVNKMHNGVCKDALFRKGIGINEYYTYEEARRKILIPTYRWMLQEKTLDIICKLREINKQGSIIMIVDRTTNTDIADISRPLSFAFLLKAYIECTSPYEDAMEEYEEHRTVTNGRKECDVVRIKKRPKLITIYNDAQRRFDF